MPFLSKWSGLSSSLSRGFIGFHWAGVFIRDFMIFNVLNS